MATRESVREIGSVLPHYNELIVVCTVKHQMVVQLAESAAVPIIDAMTDLLHPCQILTDLYCWGEVQSRYEDCIRRQWQQHQQLVARDYREVPIPPCNFISFGFRATPADLEQARFAKVSRIEIIQDPYMAIADADVVYGEKWSTTSNVLKMHICRKQVAPPKSDRRVPFATASVRCCEL